MDTTAELNVTINGLQIYHNATQQIGTSTWLNITQYLNATEAANYSIEIKATGATASATKTMTLTSDFYDATIQPTTQTPAYGMNVTINFTARCGYYGSTMQETTKKNGTTIDTRSLTCDNATTTTTFHETQTEGNWTYQTHITDASGAALASRQDNTTTDYTAPIIHIQPQETYGYPRANLSYLANTSGNQTTPITSVNWTFTGEIENYTETGTTAYAYYNYPQNITITAVACDAAGNCGTDTTAYYIAGIS